MMHPRDHVTPVRLSESTAQDLRTVCKATLEMWCSMHKAHSLAHLLGYKRTARITEWKDPAKDDFAQPWQVVKLERYVGSRAITERMAEAHGCRLVEVDRDPLDLCPRSFGELGKEAGDVISHAGLKLSARHWSAKDDARLIEEIDQNIQHLERLKARLIAA